MSERPFTPYSKEQSIGQKREKPPKEKKGKPIKKVSAKMASDRTKINASKRLARERDNYTCQGCGVPFVEVSHHCSEADCKGDKRHLAWDIDNLAVLCRECHTCWSDKKLPELFELRNLDTMVNYIKAHDVTRYNQLVVKIEAYKNNQL